MHKYEILKPKVRPFGAKHVTKNWLYFIWLIFVHTQVDWFNQIRNQIAS